MLRAKTIIISLATFAISGIAFADDGVVVDLSVLNNLNSSYYVESEPMFPVLPKRKVAPAAKQFSKKPVLNKKKTVKSDKIKKEELKPLDKPKEEIVIVDVEPVSYPQLEAKPNLNSEAEAIKNIENERLPKIENIVEPTSNESAKVDLSGDKQNEAVIADEVPAAQTRPLIDAQPIANTLKENPVNTALLVDDQTSRGENVVAPVEPQNSNALQFAEDEDELSADNQEKIDEIIAKFKNEKNSKVAIYAYNLDDGVDSFRKKRASLNRAIEVRSYLLRKGFKNFSIKVVNIAEKSSKVNTVEIEEI